MWIYHLFALCMIVIKRSTGIGAEHGFWRPDFESEWLYLEAQGGGNSSLTLDHGLGEVPILVDVQVKGTDPLYGDVIFTGIGAFPRDDDVKQKYGAVVYLYNDVNVMVIAPNDVNDAHRAGAAIYTGKSVANIGPHQQLSYTVLVRVRAWRSSSLLVPDFSVTGIPVEANTNDTSKLYVERDHSLGEYPALVRVRTRITVDGEDWLSDAVGSTLAHIVAGHSPSAVFVAYGFNDAIVRVWVPNTGKIFRSQDASIHAITIGDGLLEMFAWKARSVMKPKFTHRFPIGPNVVSEQLQQDVPNDMSTGTSFVSVWAESLSGNNKGFRFPGSGSFSFAKRNSTSSTCTYGGLTYGFTSGTIKLWRPTETLRGGVICISDVMGAGINSQVAHDADVVVHWWDATLLNRAAPFDGASFETCT